MTALASPRLRSLVASATEAEDRCELCGGAIADRHGHVLDRDEGTLLCACRACALLFDRDAAAAGRLRRVPERATRLQPFAMDDAAWHGLRIPVDMAYFVCREDGVAAYYPSAAGAVAATVPPDAWADIACANPLIGRLTPDVEALLVNRLAGSNSGWITGIDVCARLVAVMRSSWRGLTGGSELRRAMSDFFEGLP